MNSASFFHKPNRFKGKIHLVGLLILVVLVFSNVHVNSAFTGLSEKSSYSSRKVMTNVISSVHKQSSSFAYQLNLDFGTFLGSGHGQSIAVDANGNSYLAGYTNGQNFILKNAYKATYGGGTEDAFIAKFSPNGSLLFSSFFGGNDSDQANSIAVDSSGNFFITGTTLSRDFPLKNTYKTTYSRNGNIFIAEFNTTGSLIFSTLFGSPDEEATSIGIDNADNIYITGIALPYNFPFNISYNKTSGAFGGYGDAYVAKFNSTGFLMFSTLLGSVYNFHSPSLVVDRTGNCFIIGGGFTPNFPTTISYTKPYKGYSDVFVTKLNATGYLVFSTMLGGTKSDYGAAIALTRSGSIVITGSTDSIEFPVRNAYNNTYGGFGDAFFAKLNSTGHLMFSTFLGGSGTDEASSIAVDSSGNSYVIGDAYSPNFPIINSYNKTLSFDQDFLTKYNSTGYLIFSAVTEPILSSIAIDKTNNIYITGNSLYNELVTKGDFNNKAIIPRVIIAKFYPPLKVLVNTTQPTFLETIILFLTSPIVGGSLLGGFIITLVIVLVFYSYIQEKRKTETDDRKSFISFLKEKFTRQRKDGSEGPISASTFELLEEIEQENKEEK